MWLEPQRRPLSDGWEQHSDRPRRAAWRLPRNDGKSDRKRANSTNAHWGVRPVLKSFVS